MKSYLIRKNVNPSNILRNIILFLSLNVLADRSTESGHQYSSDVIALNFQNLHLIRNSKFQGDIVKSLAIALTSPVLIYYFL